MRHFVTQVVVTNANFGTDSSPLYAQSQLASVHQPKGDTENCRMLLTHTCLALRLQQHLNDRPNRAGGAVCGGQVCDAVE